MTKPATDPERWRRVDEIVVRCLAVQGAARAALLEELCAHDPELDREVRSLLAREAQLPEFLAAQAAPVPQAELDQDEDWSGRRVGGFRLESVLGRGGMGTVYQAWQERPGRPAAVKVLHGRLAQATDTRRFEFEAQVLGTLRHPAIAHLYESGLAPDPESSSPGRPYLALELVHGARSITRYAREEGLALEARLRLFLQVCAGVQHAHAHGVLHRDLKPSNLLVDEGGSARVIDFGIARPLGDLAGGHTAEGALLGTLQYMSPQQCGGRGEQVDVQSDVYSLGLVLYELATARRPYEVEGSTLYDAVRIIGEQAPERPSRLEPACRGDLDVVILKALEKEPADRYASVGALVEDLQRVLAREPIAARPAGVLRRLVLFSRRNPLAAVAMLVALLALVGGGVSAAVLALQEGRARRGAERQARINAEVNDFLNRDLLGSIDPYSNADPEIRVRDALEAASLRVEGRFANDPLIEAGVRSSIGRAFQAIGLLERAAPHLARALTLLRAELGEQHSETLEAAIALALCRLGQDELEQAEREARRVLARLPESEPLLRAHGQVVLGGVASERGQYAQALEHLRTASDLLAQAPGEHELERLTLLSRVAHCQRQLGDLDEARRLEQDAYERSRELFGDEHPRTVASLEDLALLQQDMGQLEEAYALLQRCLEVNRRTQGERHYATLRTRRNLALLTLQLRSAEQALAEIEPTYDALLESLGRRHQLTLSAAVVLGQVHTRLGHFEDAEGILGEAVSDLRERFGATHPDTLEATLTLARALAARAAKVEAIDLLQAAATAIGSQPPTERNLAVFNELGRLLLDEGRAEEAAPVLRRAAEGMRALFGSHPGTAVTLLNLGRCLVGLGLDQEAEPALASSLEIGVQLWGERHGFPRQVRSALAALYLRQGRDAEAAALRAVD